MRIGTRSCFTGSDRFRRSMPLEIARSSRTAGDLVDATLSETSGPRALPHPAAAASQIRTLSERRPTPCECAENDQHGSDTWGRRIGG